MLICMTANGEGQENTAPEKSKLIEREERILQFWEEQDIFKKSVAKAAPQGDFVFYDGPPFATGLPHYGHLVPGTMKDVIPRYKTMRGYRVVRRWGWDTQGVPIEALVQQENNLTTKHDIEAFGIGNFNQAARATIFRYADDWRKIIPRTGRWADFDDLYITMAPSYTESIWWMWKTLYEKELAYEGFKTMQVSPPLETALSNFEVNQGYKDITDISLTAKFELVDEPRTFVLAWTTTPWTLPGNVALAINKDVSYVRVSHDGATYIVAEALVAKVFADKEHTVTGSVDTATLLGKSYKPVFEYYTNDAELPNRANGWKIYHGDFVTTEDGTGVVHIATAFGEDDLKLGQQYNLPFIQHVRIDGTIKPEVTDFAGRQAKPKADPTETDVEVIKNLAHRGLLFSKAKYTHSYPHCYRTDAPLLNFAMSSWFIKVTALKDSLVAENEKVQWVPEFVGKNRFGNWLKEAKDWAVSRARYWGTPIPIWKSENGKEIAVIGSLAELREKTKSTATITCVRHGLADHNMKHVLSEDNSVPSHLTEKGKADVLAAAKKLSKVDVIYTSPLIRCAETATLIADALGLSKEQIIVDDRLKELQTGINNQPVETYHQQFTSVEEKFTRALPGGETLTDFKKRVGDFVYEIAGKHEGKHVLVVSHEYSIWLMMSAVMGWTVAETIAEKMKREDFVEPAETLTLPVSAIPRNEQYELDFHRPYIDTVTFMQNGKLMKRIPDVFDTWIDSGSVPFASNHYPFNKERFDPQAGLFKKAKGYPADFIAEGLDQTRGWFYAMLVLNTALFGRAPYKHVLVNGLLLAEDGRKMSKRLKNYPDMHYVLDKYGADALRYFLMASPLVRAEEALFSEKGVDEVMKKLLGRLDNVVSFYELYKDESVAASDVSKHVLDVWILSKLALLEQQVRTNLDAYTIDRAARPIMDFVDDVSTWYLRRSRDRFKDNDADTRVALATTRYVLLTLAKIMAPFTPFIAEDMYQRVGGAGESVHLEAWPTVATPNTKIVEQMELVRVLVTKILEARTNAGIKVRQPLQAVVLKDTQLAANDAMLSIIKDEVNVKTVTCDATLETDVLLDTVITPELKQEGDVRELMRFVQGMRKDAGLTPDDMVAVHLSSNAEALIASFKDDIMKTVKASEIVFDATEGTELVLDSMTIKVTISK
jgi:isoleucyl-tRNA synthetase